MLFLNPPPGTVQGAFTDLSDRGGTAVFVNDESEVEFNDNPAEASTTRPSDPIVRHSEFFFDNTLIAIRIENTLFNVHKYQLAKSEVFSAMFKLLKPKDDKPQQGSSPEHPIVIHGATASDFAALLKVLYASQFSSNQLTPEASLVIPAFRFSNLLNFTELRAYLLPLAEKNLDDVDKIVFAREFDIKDWLAPAHIRLCEREGVLSTEEASKLGVHSLSLVLRTAATALVWGNADSPAEIPTAKPSESIIRHSEFLFENTLIAIQIENTLFNVHKYQLAKSGVFSDIFVLPNPEGNEPEEGSLPEHPIVIRGASSSDFAALLKVLYASRFSTNQLAPGASLVIPASRLASILDFSEICAYLLSLAEKNLDDVDKIVFAREFDIMDWLAPAFIRLCQRETVLSVEEARKLDVKSVLLIWRIQEHHCPRSSGSMPVSNFSYCQICAGWQYNGTYNGTCYNCSTCARDHYLVHSGPSKIGGNIDVNDTALEAAVKKWVEDGSTRRA